MKSTKRQHRLYLFRESASTALLLVVFADLVVYVTYIVYTLFIILLLLVYLTLLHCTEESVVEALAILKGPEFDGLSNDGENNP
jgi:hypothetical protein